MGEEVIAKAGVADSSDAESFLFSDKSTTLFI